MKKEYYILLISSVMPTTLRAQAVQKRFGLELNQSIQNIFGLSDRPAELTKGIDSSSYDYKGHLYAAYQRSMPSEISCVHTRNNLQLRMGYSTFSQNIGLKRNVLKSSVTPFTTAKIHVLKLSALYRLAETQKHYPFGFYAGFHLSVSTAGNFKTDTAFNRELHVKSGIQFNWGMDYFYSIKLGKNNIYYIFAAASVTFPGLMGCVGKLNSPAGSPYGVQENRLSTYSVKASIGLGLQIPYSRKEND